ncbi:MAG: hypothetical protein IJ560_03640 [Alphaproteobacteria bacterium]|nr:hypothetical protein [Alphaproteobacteria bacterium]
MIKILMFAFLCIGGIGAANALVQPDNTTLCVSKNFTVTYNCGEFGGNVPDSQPVAHGKEFTTAPATACGGNISAWRVNMSDDRITPDTTIVYNYVGNITLTPIGTR